MRSIEKLTGLKESELRRLAPLAFAHGLVLSTVYMLKPLRNALFLTEFGADQLPWALLLGAGVGALAALVVPRLPGAAPARSFGWFTGLFAVSFPVAWWLLQQGEKLATYAFYVWVNLFGLVATSLLWLVANTVFDAREARRVFGLFGAAGIAGAILGGLATDLGAHALGTGGILLVGSLSSGVAIALVQLTPPGAPAPRRSLSEETALPSLAPGSRADGLGSSPLVMALVPMAALTALVSALVDVQFNVAVASSLGTVEDRTAFFGRLFAIVNAIAFAFQLFITPRILRNVGVGPALFALPVSLTLGAAVSWFLPGLATASWVKTLDMGFRHSLHKSAFEVVFLPVPPELKRRAKVFIDSTLDNLGTGLGAILALLVLDEAGPRALGAVALLASLLWLGTVGFVRSAYLAEFRRALARREIDPDSLRVNLTDPASVGTLVAALESTNERQLVYALRVLSTAESVGVVAPTLRLLGHPAAEVRMLALRVLERQADATAEPQVRALLRDPDASVRRQAMSYVCSRSSRPREFLEAQLMSEELELQSAALGYLAEHDGPLASQLLSPAHVSELLKRPGPSAAAVRRELASLLGGVVEGPLQPVAERLRADPDPSVVDAGIHAVERVRAKALVPWLVTRLGERRFRRSARHALVAFGPEVVPELAASLTHGETSEASRRQLPRVLARIACQASVEVSLGALAHATGEARTRWLKALNRLRRSPGNLAFRAPRVLPEVELELARAQELTAFLRGRPGRAEQPAQRLLWRALEEKRNESLERLFRLLALIHPPADVYTSYLALASPSSSVRANALELLDNVLGLDVKRRVMPLLERVGRLGASEPPPALAGNFSVPVAELLESSDAWLRACAVYAAEAEPSYRPLVARLLEDPNGVVREIARRVLERWEARV
jgi:ATP/ADP translocase/HEAT repeat protein